MRMGLREDSPAKTQNLEQRRQRPHDVKKQGAVAAKADLGGKAGRNPAHAERVEDRGSDDEESVEREGDQEKREDAKWALCTGCIVLAIYGFTLSRGLAGGDSGDLVASACSIGVAHPPGYPLFTMLGAIAVRILPLGNKAMSVNLVSAVCGAISAAMHFSSISSLLGRGSLGRSGALVGAASFAFMPLTWQYSTHAEVFSLNNALLSSFLLLLLRYTTGEAATPSTARWGCLLIGLALSNQHTSLFYTFPSAAYLLAAYRSTLLSPSIFSSLALCGLVGLLPYLYIVIASLDPPLGSWGETATLDGFINHFMRKEYGTFKLYSGSDQQHSGVPFATLLYIKDFARETFFIGPLLAAAGVARATGFTFAKDERKRLLVSSGMAKREPAALILAILVLYHVAFHTLSNLDLSNGVHLAVHRRFWMQSNLVACAFLGGGFKWLCEAAALPTKTAMQLAVSLAVLFCAGGWPKGYSNPSPFEGYGRAFLDYMPRGAVLLVHGDINTLTVRYQRQCYRVRPDIVFLDQVMMSNGWYAKTQAPTLKQSGIVFPGGVMAADGSPDSYTWEMFLEANVAPDKPPVFECGGYHMYDAAGAKVKGFSRDHPAVGLCHQVFRDGQDIDIDSYKKTALFAHQGLTTFEYPDPRLHGRDSWEYHILGQLWQRRYQFAKNMVGLWSSRQDQHSLSVAVSELKIISTECKHSGMPSVLWRDLADALTAQVDLALREGDDQSADRAKTEAIAAYKHFVSLEPRAAAAVEERIALLESSQGP